MSKFQARPRIVFAAPIPPFPLDGGGPIRMHRLLTGLAKSFDVTLVTFEHHPESGRPHCRKDELQERLPGVEVEVVGGIGPRPTGSGLAARAAAILSPHSSAWRPYLRLAGFRDAVRRAAERTSASLVHFDLDAVGMFGPLPGCVNVYAPHNIEHRILRANAKLVRGRKRLWSELNWRKLRREERRTWQSMDLCLAVSERDAEQMRAGGARRVEICPNGTDPVKPLPLPSRNPGEPLRILFVGNGRYEPNARGLSWFVSEVLPRITATLPARLDVVGHPPERPIQSPQVTFAGLVPGVEPWYERAHVVVVPIFEGSGTRLKIPEALAYGRPVVSTSLGAEGLPVEPDKHFLQADDPESFARAVVELAEECEDVDNRQLVRMLDGGRATVTRLFWPKIVAQLIDLYRTEIDRVGRSTRP